MYAIDDDRAIWSQRFDRPDRGDEWNSVVGNIAGRVLQALVDAEAARAQREHPNNLDQRDLYFAARATATGPETKQGYLARIALIERALAIDPDYIVALQRKILLFTSFVTKGFSSDRDADIATANNAADRVLQLAPNQRDALLRKALVLRVQGNLDGAAALIRKTIELDPLDGGRHRELGMIQMGQGRYKEALESFMTAKRLIGKTDLVLDQGLAYALLANDRFPEAIAQAQLTIAEWPPEGGPDAEVPWLVLIAAESEDGQDAQARADLQKFLATPRTFRTIADIQRSGLMHFATIGQPLDGLRRAGMSAE